MCCHLIQTFIKQRALYHFRNEVHSISIKMATRTVFIFSCDLRARWPIRLIRFPWGFTDVASQFILPMRNITIFKLLFHIENNIRNVIHVKKKISQKAVAR